MPSLRSSFRALFLATPLVLSALPGASAQQAPVALAATAEPRPKGVPEDARALMDLAYVENGHAQQKLDLYLPAQPKGATARLDPWRRLARRQ